MRSVATISVAHNYIRIFGFYGEFLATVIKPFCKAELTRFGLQAIPGTRKKIRVPTHVFAKSNNEKTEYRMPSSMLKEFLDFAEYRGYNKARVVMLEEPEITGHDVTFNIQPEYQTPRPDQKEWIDYQLGPGPLKVNNQNTGGGKDQRLSSKIKVPGGWTTMGAIKVGDTVTAWDGTPTKVTGVYPQGVKRVFKITFEDGRSTEAGLGHLWKIYDIFAPGASLYSNGKLVRTKEQVEKNRWRIVTTEELIKLKELPERWRRIYVPLCKSEQVGDKTFKIHPYVMGVILGDGCLSQGCVTITKPYQQLFDKVQSLLPKHIECKWVDDKTFTLIFASPEHRKAKAWHPRESLKELDLMGKRSWEKEIPVEYLHGSHEQRLNLLQGLLDTDGTVSRNDKGSGRAAGTISFSSSSEKLAKGVQYLVRSLGGIAKLSTRTPSFTHKGETKEGRMDYRVHIRHPNPELLLTLNQKCQRATQTQYSESLKLRIADIEELPMEETQCISVEHVDRLYVTDDFIVTHNTYMSLFSMAKISKRTLVTIQPRYITTWENDIAKMMQVEPKDVLKWEFADLPRLAQLCREGTIDPKIIILPTTRITAYLKQCKLDPSLPSLDQIIADINPGLRIIDESHESFHEVCMSLLYGNLPKFFLLSATLKGDDPFMNRMYKAVAPTSVWLKEPDPENYIDIVAWLYSINTRKHRVSTMQFGSYSDIAFEKSILRNPKLLDFYFELADEMYRTFYLDIKEEGTKCLLFFTLIEMCQYMVKRFRERYPGEDFDSFLGTLDKKTPTKYLEHENLVTTPGSTGTGKDIPGSVTLLCFHTVFSIQRNKQIIGRLRQLFGKFGGRITPRFVFPVCVDIPKHGECFKKRKLALAGKQKTWRTMQSNLEAA